MVAHCGQGACRFAVVGWLKMFVGLARDRFDSLVSSPTATPAAHARTLALLLLLFVNDVAWIVAFLSSREAAPVSHIMLWMFDTVVAALEAAAILVKYGEPRSCHSGHMFYQHAMVRAHQERDQLFRSTNPDAALGSDLPCLGLQGCQSRGSWNSAASW